MVKEIQNSDILIKNGLGIDSFVNNITSESESLKIVVASEGSDKLKYVEESIEEDNNHEHEQGEYDPHVWLNINNAIKECENIKNVLVEVDNKNKSYYEENYNNYIKLL